MRRLLQKIPSANTACCQEKLEKAKVFQADADKD
jgi:hypothetical protein